MNDAVSFGKDKTLAKVKREEPATKRDAYRRLAHFVNSELLLEVVVELLCQGPARGHEPDWYAASPAYKGKHKAYLPSSTTKRFGISDL